MNKTILSVRNNKENKNRFNVSYKYSGPGRDLFRLIKPNKIRKNISIDEIFQDKKHIENIVISKNAFEAANPTGNFL